MDCEDLVSESESDDEESHDETPSTYSYLSLKIG
jgi:hypothetical protein